VVANLSISSSSAPVERWPRAAIFAISVCLLIEFLVGWNADKFADPLQRTTYAKFSDMADPTVPNDIVVFGDSRAFSVRPALVSEAIGGGLTAKNYTWGFHGVEAYTVALRTLIAAGKPPKIIVATFPIEFTSRRPIISSVEEQDDYRERMYSLFPVPVIARTLIEWRRMKTFEGLIASFSAPPTARLQKTLTKILSSYLHGFGWPNDLEMLLHIPGEYEKHGAFLMLPKWRRAKNYLDALLAGAGPIRKPDQGILALYEQFLREANDVGAKVILLDMPLPQPYVDVLEKGGAVDEWRRIQQEWARRLPNVSLAPMENLGWPEKFFTDHGHLNRAGDELFQADYPARLKR